MNDPGAPRAIRLDVNGETHAVIAEPRLLLLDCLRDELGLGGTHAGCEHGACGACTVLLDGEPTRSCLMFAVQAGGHEITTIEGITPAEGEALHPVQEAFSEQHGLQCGFCTPGMIITAVALLEEDPDPSEEAIRTALGGNICRCTGYVNIVRSVRAAAARGKA
ncbi:MAG: aerobic carbon-monoxide dehydrogenase small subunit [Solirubrobacteraceae bacterium]|jgi:carbon-monoxide dehydrogenase small subunit|nr:aerobic carbon-monoxide dehydrogenase small subunit [Solirubrobacteraceae bacterium]MEA2319613.1 aerobic carbon-monoxide dehydrogenase small subunit [Solirubrobacteraceae bacterium]